jgi:hypothetical protein
MTKQTMTLLERLKLAGIGDIPKRATRCVGMTQEEVDNLPIGALIETRVGDKRGYYVYMGDIPNISGVGSLGRCNFIQRASAENY